MVTILFVARHKGGIYGKSGFLATRRQIIFGLTNKTVDVHS